MLTAYADAVPTLRAEESLGDIADGRVAALATKPSSAKSRVRDLERQVARTQPRRPADPERLRAAGIAVQFV